MLPAHATMQSNQKEQIHSAACTTARADTEKVDEKKKKKIFMNG